MNNFRVGRWSKSDEGRPRIEVMEEETYVATIREYQSSPGTHSHWAISGALDMEDGKTYPSDEDALDNLWDTWKTSPRRVRAGLHEDVSPKDIGHEVSKIIQTGPIQGLKLLRSYSPGHSFTDDWPM